MPYQPRTWRRSSCWSSCRWPDAPERDDRSNFIWMKPEQERAVVAFVERRGFLNLHNAWGSILPMARISACWGASTPGTARSNDSRLRSSIWPIRSPAASTRSLSLMSNIHLFDDRTCSLLVCRAMLDDGTTAAAGWVREQGRGRICHLANGHTLEALLHPMYQKLLCNAVRWCLRLEATATITRPAG